MKILILGSSVIGITTAYELQKDGHEVTVIDRQPKPAMETSYANAGLIAPGHAFSWAAPGMPSNLFKSIYRKDQVFRFRSNLNPQLLRWGWQFFKECTKTRSIRNTEKKFQFCRYSQQIFHKVIEETGIEFDRVQGGLLYIYRSQEALEEGVEKAEILRNQNMVLEVVDRNRVCEIEPSLEPVKEKIAGAIFAPSDEAGDTYQFTEKLSQICKQKGVEFKFNTTVKKLAFNNDRIKNVVTDQGEFKADAFVLAMGPFSPKLVKPLGIYLPIYPVKGYSITIPVQNGSTAPTGAGIDEHHFLGYARFGDRIRFTSIAEISGYSTAHSPADFEFIINAAKDLFPTAGDFSNAEYWAGLRPMTPEGIPILGWSKFENLYFNTGHGHLGWTMACGSAKIVADLIEGRETEIEGVWGSAV
tara:strand:- start:2086 stop:3330 length:1245 start_codon:yes stop_codon:yes gene_type:complete